MPDFEIGSLCVSPARRILSGPAGEDHLEPRVLQLFLTLVEADQGVVTRQQLFDACWGNGDVGEDALNRAVGKLRRSLAKVAPDEIEVETIARTGYRLHGRAFEQAAPDSALDTAPETARAAAGAPSSPDMPRRTMLAASLGALGLVAIGAVGLSGGEGEEESEPVDPAIVKADRVLRDWFPMSGERAIDLLDPLLGREPDHVDALGLTALAYRRMAETQGETSLQSNLERGLEYADRALILDPNHANALTAKATLQPEFGNWRDVEDRLREALDHEPGNLHALDALTLLLQSVGRAKDSDDSNRLSMKLDPLCPNTQYRAALKHWIFGRTAQADVVSARAYKSWPRHAAVWNARWQVLLFNGRSDQAAAMTEEREGALPFPPPAVAFYRRIAEASGDGRTGLAPRDRDYLLDAVTKANLFAVMGTMVLSHHGHIDDAFAVARGNYLNRGPYASRPWSKPGDPNMPDNFWARPMNLFTPATHAMRLDPRFDALTRDMGLHAYWQATGTAPDRFLVERA